MEEVVIVSACRTAIGSFGGSLQDQHAAFLGAAVIRETISKTGIDPGLIDDVRMGCCCDPVDTLNVARIAALLADVPDSVPAVTINRVCISGMEAVISGMAMIQSNMADVILAGGTEHMSGIPYSLPSARWGGRFLDQVLVDNIVHMLHAGSYLVPGVENGPLQKGPFFELYRGKPYIMGVTAEFIADLYSISREEMDEVALLSHNNVERATLEGDFADEIVPLDLPQKKGKPPVRFEKDEHFRPGLTMSALAALPPAFAPKIGRVTAGNSSGVNDGASALLIMSARKAKELNLPPLARIKAIGRGGCHPSVMGLSVVPAVRNLEERSGLKVADFELIELNEAFAAQYLGCEKALGINRDITNVNGSGIGLGHPVGSTGSRILVTLIHAMKKRRKTLGLATLCGGGGVSMACAIEMMG